MVPAPSPVPEYRTYQIAFDVSLNKVLLAKLNQ